MLPASASGERLAIGSGTPGESASGMSAAGERDEVGSGQIIDGRYRIVAKLGEGGMGEVYAAEHVHIEKRVAIKLLRHEILAHPEAVTRFRQEARSASSIGHENIISIEDFGKLEDGRIYLCMELLDGKPLNDLLQDPMAPERVLNILIQTCHGLAAAHRKGIVHRDMKPENIFVTVMPSGAEVPKILDFGIAKVQGNDGGNNNLTRTGTIFGTPYYMSPEQALGQRVDHRADIYAMGVIMYECFTGSIPFTGESFMGILTKHITADPTPPSQRAHENGRVLLAGIEPIILRAMKKNPEDRQNTMDELVQELVAVHRNLVGPGMSSYMEAHQVSSAGFSALGPGHPGAVTPMPMSGSGVAYRPGSNTPLPAGALPSATPFPGSATPSGGMVGYDGRYGSQPLPDSSSLALEPRRSSKVGLIAAIAAVLVVLAGTGGFLVYSGSLASVLGKTEKPETGDGVENGNGTEQAGNGTGQGQNGQTGQTTGQTGQTTGQNGQTNGQAGQEGTAGHEGTEVEQPEGTESGTKPALDTMVLLASEPPASVYENDAQIDKTPVNIRITQGKTRTLVLKRRGYEDTTVVLDGSTDRHVAKLDRKRSRGGRGDGDNDNTPPPDEDDKKPDLGNLELE
ncbi:MAG TPA: serine/threonine-protein kinase [Haliangium sp.]|nr:serine/threonine-protein kinase [Haliangium sp.]